MDFPTLLVIATFITGIIWAADAWYFAPRRRRSAEASIPLSPSPEETAGATEAEEKEEESEEPTIVEYARSFFPIILAVLIIRSFIVEPFRIPSGSMMPTLLIGDFILVNKFDYGLRLPVLNTKVLSIGEPKRGDVVVFRYPENPKVDYIKRVIGVPGDHILYIDKHLYVNGHEVPHQFLGIYRTKGSGAVMDGAGRFKENLFGVKHDILFLNNRPEHYEFYVKPHNYFVMGDNRDNSRDSRFWGTVPEENLVGKAFMIWMNWDNESDKLVDWSRIGDTIK